MKTTIYWALQHTYCAVHEFRFHTTCWWINRQVEFLEWRLRLEATMPSAQSGPAAASVGQRDQHVVHSM